MGINEIKAILKNASVEELKILIPQFEADSRAGVVKLVEAARKRVAAFEAEVARTNAMKEYERKYERCRYICGIDVEYRFQTKNEGLCCGKRTAGRTSCGCSCDSSQGY